MRCFKLSLLFAVLATNAAAALAKRPAAAIPIGSPGDWIGTDDYPAAALRFAMTGVTAFRLAVDATGKPSRCDVVASSGFDILDEATCQRLMTVARFRPARDSRGRPAEGSYSSRVRWTLPDQPRPATIEHLSSMILSIDQSGKLTSCRYVHHVPVEAQTSDDGLCEQAQDLQQEALGRALRGMFEGPSAEIEVLMATAFTSALRARAVAHKPGYEQRALSIHRLTVTKDGALTSCVFEEQRGTPDLIWDACAEAHDAKFDLPFAAFDEGGIATGWRITRVLLKTGK